MNVAKHDDQLADVFASAAEALSSSGSFDGHPGHVAGNGTDFKAQLAFHLTGHRTGQSLQALEDTVRPAPLARYRDLAALRHDFPLVLVTGDPEKHWVRSLTDIVNDLVRRFVPRGPEGERTRRCMLRLESEIRKRVSRGAIASLTTLWDQVAATLATRDGEVFSDILDPLRTALEEDGEVVDCDGQLPMRLFIHVWKAAQRQKAARLRAEIERLIVKLSDILAADFERSAEGRSSDNLQAAIGPAHAQNFDFEALSSLLTRNVVKTTLPDSRRQRIKRVLAALQSQRFVPADGASAASGGAQPLDFVFHSCGAARAAFRDRLAGLLELVKAIATAELEIEGSYIEPAHDLLFAQFDEEALGPNDLRIFPDYLVCLHAAEMADSELTTLIDVLASDLPMKVVVQTDDLLPPLGDADARFSMNLHGMRLASMALGLGDVFVMQSSASNLYQARDQVYGGITRDGPALFSVYSGAAASMGRFAPYLAAAAAMQSRAFPAFAYDPSAASHWAGRFSITGNPQPEQDWPVEPFVYEDEAHQRIEEDLAFTFVDFLACDTRYRSHFARVPKTDWNDSMVPLAQGLADEARMSTDSVPYAVLVDGQSSLQRAIVHDKLIRAAERCLDMWHGLQELGGFRRSHGDSRAAHEHGASETAKPDEVTAATPAATVPAAPAPAAAPPVASPPAGGAVVEEAEAPSDEPYIETPRCTTCNECTNLNSRMFAYDENKQAYIADINAGTYRELVEAAESCQVSIIHPGQPRNPKEPGLEELMERAAPFL